jgi:rare lipoprotein A
MSAARTRVILALGIAALSGCFSAQQRPHPAPLPATPPGAAPAPSSSPAPSPAAPAAPHPLSQAVPDAVPRIEPRSPYGNPPFYDVFGKRYYVLPSSADYAEIGVASWYGPGFHEIRTSTRETYDMYGMTAAHKTLPLPAYVRVTNLQNGLSVVVRVNDRGPFVGNRIIDLSYAAASKLDMLRNGTAMVEVRSVGPANPSGEPAALTAEANAEPAATAAPATAAAASRSAALFVQAGAFADPANADRLAMKLRGGGYGKVFVRDDVVAGRKFYRVRIGPVPDVPEFDRIVSALEHAGVHDAHLAMN